MDNEKISVNINDDKLSAIDLLIDEGLVSNRSAFINEAVDLLIQKNQKTIDAILTKRRETVSPNQWFIGLQSLDTNYLMQFKQQGAKLSLKGFGSLYLDKEIECELIRETIAFISKRIRIHGTQDQILALHHAIERKK